MKSKSSFHFAWHSLATLAFPLAPAVFAAPFYLDIDRATACDGATSPSGSWATGSAIWSTSSTGTTATAAFTAGFGGDLFLPTGTHATDMKNE